MVNVNLSKGSLARTEKVLEGMTPKPESFEDSVYPAEDVERDIWQLNNFKESPLYKEIDKRSDAKLLEKTFMETVELNDWFSEDELYGDDPDWLALSTIPTSEIDDVFNHIDMIGVINNELTDHETLPFAIDLTYNGDQDKMSKKFRWKHVYGKKDNAPESVSEFDRSLSLKNRHGLKIPGFTSAKYCEDTDTINPYESPRFKKGRIKIMPRFIVGYSPDIAEKLACPESFTVKEYEAAKMEAKWCTLIELKEQATNIRQMLENLIEEETKYMDKEELAEAKKQIIAMERYFENAFNAAKKKAEMYTGEQDAMEYAMNRDTVVQAIVSQSQSTFLRKDWQMIA